MGGLKGTITIKGLDMKSYEYLKIGEIIGAGKQTVFGLGSYIMKELT
jgi:CRISPR/Cas system endoribonuclease Cas6 (RAMP superfamily)